MYIRHKKTSDGYRYYYIVKTINKDGKNMQKTVKYLGTVEKILAVFESYEKNNK